MKIETRYNIGDTVYFILEGRLFCSLIREVKFATSTRSNEPYYRVQLSRVNSDPKWVAESHLFPTAIEACDSLLLDIYDYTDGGDYPIHARIERVK